MWKLLLECIWLWACLCACICRILDVQPNRLSVGGVRSIEPVLHRRGQIATHDFVGCIMELAVNGRPLEPSQALASRGILDRSAALTLGPRHAFTVSIFLSLPLFSRPTIFSNLLGSCCGTSVHTLKSSREFLKRCFFKPQMADLWGRKGSCWIFSLLSQQWMVRQKQIF